MIILTDDILIILGPTCRLKSNGCALSYQGFDIADLKSAEQGAQLLLQIAMAYTNGVKVSRIVDGEFEMGVMGDARDE